MSSLFTVPVVKFLTVQFLMGKRDGYTFSVWCKTNMGFKPDEPHEWYYSVSIGNANELVVTVPKSHSSTNMLHGADRGNEINIKDAYDFLAQLKGIACHRGDVKLTVNLPPSEFNINFVEMS